MGLMNIQSISATSSIHNPLDNIITVTSDAGEEASRKSVFKKSLSPAIHKAIKTTDISFMSSNQIHRSQAGGKEILI